MTWTFPTFSLLFASPYLGMMSQGFTEMGRIEQPSYVLNASKLQVNSFGGEHLLGIEP